MIQLLATIARLIGTILPWLLRAAPWVLNILTILIAFWQPAQDWVAGVASKVLPNSFSFTTANMGDISSTYWTQLNTFIPIDLFASTLALYIPFLLACLAQRLAKAWMPSKRL